MASVEIASFVGVCTDCGWVGKPRVDELRALGDFDGHGCPKTARCDTCDVAFDPGSREGRCGECGDCSRHCEHLAGIALGRSIDIGLGSESSHRAPLA
jgi:hypothetical protein